MTISLRTLLMSTVMASATMAATSPAPTSPVSGEATPAKGFYVGLSGGLGISSIKLTAAAQGPFSASGAAIGDALNVQSKHSLTGGLFGLIAGYNYPKKSLVVGVDIYGGLDSSSGSIYNTAASGAGDNGYLINITLKHKYYVGLAPRLGIMVTPGALLYVKVGAEYGKWQSTLTPSAAQINSTNNYTNLMGSVSSGGSGFSAAQAATAQALTATPLNVSKSSFTFAPGLGMELYHGKIFVRGEYTYLMGPSIRFNHNTKGIGPALLDGSAVITNMKTAQHQVKFAIGYKF